MVADVNAPQVTKHIDPGEDRVLHLSFSCPFFKDGLRDGWSSQGRKEQREEAQG